MGKRAVEHAVEVDLRLLIKSMRTRYMLPFRCIATWLNEFLHLPRPEGGDWTEKDVCSYYNFHSPEHLMKREFIIKRVMKSGKKDERRECIVDGCKRKVGPGLWRLCRMHHKLGSSYDGYRTNFEDYGGGDGE